MPRILVIDDETEVREFLVTAIGRSGYDVHAVANGLEGIHECRRSRIDMVITDLVMPEKEGLETIIEMRREHPRMPVIAISGGARGGNEHYLDAARLCGAERVFAKPVAPAELVRAIREMVGPPAPAEGDGFRMPGGP